MSYAALMRRGSGALLLWRVLLASTSSPSNEDYGTVQGVVVIFPEEDIDRPSPVVGATVALLNHQNKIKRTTFTDERGEFRIRLPVSTYDAEFEMDGFHKVVIKNIRVEEEPIDTVFAALVPAHPLIIKHYASGHPKKVPAPPLGISFALSPPVQKGTPMKGIVTITNEGNEPVLIPTRPRDNNYRPEHLLLEVYLHTSREIPEQGGPYDVIVFATFLCLPDGGNCKKLEPGQQVSLTVDFLKRSGYGADNIEIYRYDVDAEFTGQLGISFVLPKPPDEVGTRTERIRKDVAFEIRLDKD